MAVDYEGCSGIIQVYATVMIMHNDDVKFHIVTCNPRGMPLTSSTGPEWFIQLLRRAGVLSLFSPTRRRRPCTSGGLGYSGASAEEALRWQGGSLQCVERVDWLTATRHLAAF